MQAPAAYRLRARVLAQIRCFFNARGYTEVDTPILSRFGCPETGIEPVRADKGFLHTSPEWMMKRLLARMRTPIFQLCKVFRAGDISTLHWPEFTMLEWYQPDAGLSQAMDEAEALLRHLGLSSRCRRQEYADLISTELGVDIDASAESWLPVAHSLGLRDAAGCSRAQLLDFFWSELTRRSSENIYLVYHFPAAQRAYAKMHPSRSSVALRFEIITQGLELANGNVEINDSNQLRQRISEENQRRTVQGLAPCPFDPGLFPVVDQLADCTGVALGVERLLMLMSGSGSIREVSPFSHMEFGY